MYGLEGTKLLAHSEHVAEPRLIDPTTAMNVQSSDQKPFTYNWFPDAKQVLLKVTPLSTNAKVLSTEYAVRSRVHRKEVIVSISSSLDKVVIK